MSFDRYLLVRAASLYVAVVTTMIVCAWRRPPRRALVGALLGFMWNLPAVLLLHLGATWFGWWRFDAKGGLLLGMPVDVYLSWAWFWGAIPALALPSVSIVSVVLAAFMIDLVLMPAAAPVVQLGSTWLVGEAIGLALGLVPAQLLARWTIGDQHLRGRAILQVVGFSALLVFALPAVAIDGSGGAWTDPLTRPGWALSLLGQLLAIPAIVGLTAVQEFVTRGGGTPVPFDPPRRLVTSGIYAYVRNPMQLSAVLFLFLLGLVLGNLWVSAAGVMAHVYSMGLAGWDEDQDLTERFGNRWNEYRGGVRRWVPRARPWFRPNQPPARLFVSEGCAMCSEVGRWFKHRAARHLTIVTAEMHPSDGLRRITYEPGEGSPAASGVEAIARAFEHIHLGWTLVGCVLRFPILCQLTQLLADASGGGPRRVCRVAATSSGTGGNSACDAPGSTVRLQ